MNEEPTIDDIWVNGLANRIGILTAQNDRLQLENQQLRTQLRELQPEPEPEPISPIVFGPNGQLIEEPVT